MRTPYTSCTDAGTRFLTPQVWKEAQRLFQPQKLPHGWTLHRLSMVGVLLTWCAGSSAEERFLTARAFYVAQHQYDKRPGRSDRGFQQALARLPLPVLHALFAAVRQRLQQVLYRYWRSDGFLVLAMDGSRLECPRSAELEERLPPCGKPGSAPMLMVGALVLLPAGLLWSWTVAPGTANEMALLRLLPTLPQRTLLVADAFYQGYNLYADLLEARVSFLLRLSSKSELYTETRQPLERFREGLVWYWPAKLQKQQRPPLRLRLICVRGAKKQDVWLLTNVLDQQRLGRRRAAELYRWRWQVEGVFRTYKRTLPQIKLTSRTEALVYKEAEVSLPGLQLLLAQAAQRQRQEGTVVIVLGSARAQLLRVRGAITTTIGSRLGPRQQRWYRAALAVVRAGGPGRKVRRPWPRRTPHRAPKPPKVRVLSKRLKAKIHRHFRVK